MVYTLGSSALKVTAIVSMSMASTMLEQANAPAVPTNCTSNMHSNVDQRREIASKAKEQIAAATIITKHKWLN